MVGIHAVVLVVTLLQLTNVHDAPSSENVSYTTHNSEEDRALGLPAQTFGKVLLCYSCGFSDIPTNGRKTGKHKYTQFTYNNKKHLKNVGPIHYCEPPHANSPDVASGTVARRLHIDVHDNADDDNDNDNDNA